MEKNLNQIFNKIGRKNSYVFKLSDEHWNLMFEFVSHEKYSHKKCHCHVLTVHH